MYGIVYKTTCLVNGKIYVGQHVTSETWDNYKGSGKLFKCTLKKYGAQNFVRETLFQARWQEELDALEELAIEMYCPENEAGITHYNLERKHKGEGRHAQYSRDLMRRNRGTPRPMGSTAGIDTTGVRYVPAIIMEPEKVSGAYDGLFTCNGVTDYIAGWTRRWGLAKAAVYNYMREHSCTAQEAMNFYANVPREERGNKHYIEYAGIRDSVAGWTVRLGLSRRVLRTYAKTNNCGVEKAVAYYYEKKFKKAEA